MEIHKCVTYLADSSKENSEYWKTFGNHRVSAKDADSGNRKWRITLAEVRGSVDQPRAPVGEKKAVNRSDGAPWKCPTFPNL